MRLIELYEMINGTNNVQLAVDGEFIVGNYKEDEFCEEAYMEYEVSSFYATIIDDEPYLSIDLDSKYAVELWGDEEAEEVVEAIVNKETGDIATIMSDHWKKTDEVPYTEGLEFLKSEGYTKLYLKYDSYEKFVDSTSMFSPYGYV